jgi:SAM-dependent methyltransferase
MLREIRLARFVLVIASPAYRQRAEGDAPAGEGRGVQYEASLIREEVYGNPKAALNRILPVILPGGSPSDIPAWLGPTSTTYYTVSEFTERGAEKLLRLLTGQPYETVPPLGRRPVLPPRAGRPATGTGGAAQDPLLGLVRRLADRSQVRNEAMVQADVRQLLLTGSLGLDPDDLGAELEHRRRIDLALRSAVIEVRGDLRRGALADAAEELVGYLAVRGDQTGWEYVGVLTDGAEWHLYSHLQGKPKHLMSLTVDPADPNVDELLRWLDEALADGPKLEPTPQEIVRRLGAESRSHTYLARELARLYEQNRDLPTVKVKRDLWAKLLTTALGTNFTDEDSLFIDHTLLVMIAKVIGHAVVGFHPEASHITARRIVSGELFTAAQIGGVVEGDFFDWIIEVPGGDRFVKHLARRLARFAWEQVEHDVMKVLYESIISRRIRHLLGEYYTPGWLAEAIIAECVDDPLAQRVLDASCGSGTFLFHAVRRYLAAAEDAGMSGPEAIQGVTANVIGIDVHPVAVTLARVTYLLAIGMHRLYVENRPRFAVPVYLGDSLRWGQEETLWSYGGLSVPTAADHEMFLNEPDFSDEIEFSEKLKFPERVIGDARRFDMLVNHMAQRAVQRDRGSPVPSLTVVFRRFEIVEDDRPVLERTFQIMCELHDNWKDHIWGYYVRNLARPLWLARPDNRIDVLVGNPPWLAYRYMTRNQQASFRRMSMERGLWRGATVATNQDLSALFVVRCVELYLRPGGRFGYVMPWATLSRGQYAGFRTGDFPVRSEPVKVSFNQPWDLQRVKPAFFPLPASVVFGRRQNGNADAAALPQVPQAWSGRFATHTASWAQAAPSLGRTIGEPPPPSAQRSSPYAKRFSQGATVVPRFLFVVEPDTTGPLGTGAGRRAVRSLRAANEKTPWKALLTLHGIVEEQFIRPLYVGNSILPFRCLQPAEAIIPWDGEQLLPGDDELLDWYPGLAEWWHTAEGAWHGNRSSERLSLLEQLDYRGKLSQQLPAPRYRVVYSASGMYLAAAVVSDPTAVIEHRLYWGSAENLNEARFLTAILNSNTLTMAVRPLQARGEHNPRHFDKYVFQLPIPLYDAHDVAHRWLVELAERSKQVAANVDLPDVRFEAQRRRVREALAEDGVAADIDAIVKELLIR